MDTGNVLAVSGGKDVQIHGVLESTLNSMTVAWTQLLSKIAESNGKLAAGMNQESNAFIDKLTADFQTDITKVNEDIGKFGKSASKNAKTQGHISELEARMSELQQVDSGSSSQAGSVADDASNKVKQAVESASSLVGSTASQIPQMIFGTTAQLTQQISA